MSFFIFVALVVAAAICFWRNEVCGPVAIGCWLLYAVWQMISHSLNPDFVDPVDAIVKVSSTETEKKKTKGHEIRLKDAEEQLRGERQQSCQREENLLATIQRLCADKQRYRVEIQRRKQAEQQANNQAAEGNRKFTRLGKSLQRAEGEGRAWRRKYEELHDLNPEAETNVIRFKEVMAAKEALMDENTRKQEVINRLETQLMTALPLKNQFSPCNADIISITADRDQLVEHVQALHQAACWEIGALQQELQTGQQQKREMFEEGQKLYQENQNLREQCQDLTTRLTLAQQSVETGNVEAPQIQHDALEQKQVARLEAVRIEYEGKLKKEREASEAKLKAEMKDLQEQAEKWVNDNLSQVHAEVEANFAQRLQALQGEKMRLQGKLDKLDDDLAAQAASAVLINRESDEVSKSTTQLLGKFQALVENNAELEEKLNYNLSELRGEQTSRRWTEEENEGLRNRLSILQYDFEGNKAINAGLLVAVTERDHRIEELEGWIKSTAETEDLQAAVANAKLS